jgi:hypothetical protein
MAMYGVVVEDGASFLGDAEDLAFVMGGTTFSISLPRQHGCRD